MLRPLSLLPLLSLAACSGSGDGDGPAAEDSALPDAPYLGEDAPEEDPSFDADEVSQAVADVLAAVRQIDAGPVLSLYLAMMEGADAACPQWTAYDGYPTWLDACTASSGVSFDGYGLMVSWDGADLDGSGVYWSGYQLYSVAAMQTSTGDTLTLGGEAGLLFGASPEGLRAFYSYVGEGTRWDGAETGTWLDWGIAPQIYLLAYHEPVSDTKVVQLGGAIEVESGPVAAVVLDGLYMVKDPTDALCSQEPSGTISILDSEGRWYDLIFDGPSESRPETDMARCDGCAEAWYRGQSIGQACVDFSALTDWDDNPWGY